MGSKRKPKRVQSLPDGVIVADVPSPYKNGTDRVLRVVNEHPLDYYHHKAKKLNAPEYQAGMRYFTAYTVWNGQTNLSIDLTQDKVDTSGRPEPITIQQIDAAQIIKEATKALGHQRAYRFQLITGEGWFPRDVARRVDGHTSKDAGKRERDFWIESLAIVARVYGY